MKTDIYTKTHIQMFMAGLVIIANTENNLHGLQLVNW